MGRVSKPPVYVLLSGGLDSTACLHFYKSNGYDVKPLHVQYGQGARVSELHSARAVARFYGLKLRCVTVSGIRPAPSGEIVGRNAFLFSTALMGTGSGSALVTLGVHAGTRYFDCQSSFVRLWEQMFDGYTDGRIQIGTPFINWSKSQIWQYCLQNKIPVKLTWSCESRSLKACGRCLSCKDKEALIARSGRSYPKRRDRTV